MIGTFHEKADPAKVNHVVISISRTIPFALSSLKYFYDVEKYVSEHFNNLIVNNYPCNNETTLCKFINEVTRELRKVVCCLAIMSMLFLRLLLQATLWDCPDNGDKEKVIFKISREEFHLWFLFFSTTRVNNFECLIKRSGCTKQNQLWERAYKIFRWWFRLKTKQSRRWLG